MSAPLMDCHAYPCPCVSCGHPTFPGSGRYVDRIPAATDKATGYMCPWCAEDMADPDGLAPVDPRDTYRDHGDALRQEAMAERERARTMKRNGLHEGARDAFIAAAHTFATAGHAYAHADDTPAADAMWRAMNGAHRSARAAERAADKRGEVTG